MQAPLRPLALLLALAAPLAAGTRLELQPDYSMRIEGTSNLRAWGADARGLTVDYAAADWPVGAPATWQREIFAGLTLQVPVAEIKSGTKGLSGKIHKYLKEDRHPRITFALHRVSDLRATADGALVRAEGTVHAAGVGHRLAIEVALTAAGDTLRATGRATLRMSDFGIKPPTALFGTIRAGDEFAVTFALPLAPGGPGHANAP